MSYFLSCGRLKTNLCTLGDYVIEWRLNSRSGGVVFVSGEGSDPDIQAQHPLVDEIVTGGTLYPIIRYAYMNGSKYTAEFEPGAFYSPDFVTCLDPIYVEEINCDTLFNASANYNYRLTREVNIGEKNRSIKFDIDSDVNYIAWAFIGVQIPDKLNVYYCKGNDPNGEIIDSVIVGATGVTTDYNPSNYPRQSGYDPESPVTPIIFSSLSQFRYISDLTGFTYETGDWIRFEIIGNVLNPDEDETKWTLEIKCFDSLDLSNNFINVGGFVEGSVVAQWDPVNCWNQISFQFDDHFSSVNNDSNIFMRKYLTFSGPSSFSSNVVGGASAYQSPAGTMLYRFPKSTILTSLYFGNVNGSQNTCLPLAGQITIEKTSTHLNLSFTDSADYDLVANNIAAVQAHAKYTEFLSSTPADIGYYSAYMFSFRLSTGCDQSASTKYFYIHLSSTVTFTSPTSISLTLVEITNQYPDPQEDCNFIMSTINNRVSLINSTKNEANNTYYTNVRFGNGEGLIPRGLAYSPPVVNNGQAITRGVHLQIPKIILNNLFDITAYGFCETVSSYIVYRSYETYDRVTITDTNDPLNNFKIERSRYLETHNCNDLLVFDTVYEQTPPTSSTTTSSTTLP